MILSWQGTRHPFSVDVTFVACNVFTAVVNAIETIIEISIVCCTTVNIIMFLYIVFYRGRPLTPWCWHWWCIGGLSLTSGLTISSSISTYLGIRVCTHRISILERYFRAKYHLLNSTNDCAIFK